jgi:cytochrome c-type biogenesis protein CcmF
MAQIGYFSLILALLCTAYVIVVSIIGIKAQGKKWIVSAANALYLIAGLFTVAVFVLLYFLLQRNFQILYVASYTNLALPAVYAISALWAGQKGSLLFWGWILSLCSGVFIWKYKKKATTELPYTYIGFAVTLGLFLALLTIVANPFEQLDFTPPDGNGMNPLLQNPYMAIHPPVLFIGYAGFIVPFALAFAALCTGTISDEWLKHVRRWTLFSWYFLGIGIILGAHWAYLELGWGGYWAWDPVENASFIPWLTSTALIHTLILQKRRGLLKLWNIFLSILTFSLCIFGTFITRSGILSSVHAYGQSPIGYYFLTFLALIFIGTGGLIGYRWKSLRSYSEEDSLLSKEGSFFLTNQIFMGLSVAIFLGTMFPFLSELFMGNNIKTEVSAAFFNRISIPVGLVLLGLMGICQQLSWKKTSSSTLTKQFLFPLGVAFVGMIFLFVFGLRHLTALLTCGLGLLVLTTICNDVRNTFSRRLNQEPFLKPSVKLFVKALFAQRRRYTAYIFHLGTVLVYFGIAISAAYQLEREVSLRPGESSILGTLRFQYEQLGMRKEVQKDIVFAEVTIFRNEKKIATVRPEKRFYDGGSDTQVTTEIGLHSSLKEDIYVILASWEDDQRATFTLIINPMIVWIWVGGFFVFTIGFVVIMLPQSRGNEI